MRSQVTASKNEQQALPCPECRMRGIGGAARLGSRRTECVTCNNFAQTVGRMARQKLKERYPEEYEELRAAACIELYPQVIEDFTAERRLEMVDNPEWEGIRGEIPPQPVPLEFDDTEEPIEVSWDPSPIQGSRGQVGLR